jgi:sterol desaturase/sphingolipid hydroxylase (fatty acid hydroxylase superfamily)
MLALFVLLGSLVIASFFGHVIHWALHQRWSGAFNRAHMEHHQELYPPGRLTSIEYRAAKWQHRGALLFTPPLLIILATFGGLLWWAGAPPWAVWVLGGCLVGFGLLNDYVHDAFHVRRHWLQRFKHYRAVRILHFVHHHDMGCNYGIFWLGWDKVFGTLKSRWR